MSVVTEVVAKLRADPSSFVRGMNTAQQAAQRMSKDSGRASTNISKSMQKAGKDVESFGQKSHTMSTLVGTALGGFLTNAATQATTAFVDFAKESITAASDMNETVSKVGVLFGSSSAQVEKFAETAATSFGQSKQQALDASATFAVFGKSAGLSGSKLASFSTGFAGLASDMASFHNTSPEEAITAIGAALRGETEPIRRYGVLLDDMSMRQEAVKIGLIKTTKTALTPQNKVLAAQALIYKSLGKQGAIGDFMRTSGGLANQQRILAAQFEDLKVKAGQAFLPAVLLVVKALNQFLFPALDKIGAIAGPAWNKLVKLAKPVITAVMRMVKPFTDVKKNTASMGKTMQEVFTRVGPWFQSVIKAAVPLVTAVMNLGKVFIANLLPTLMQAWGIFQKNVIPVFLAIGDILFKQLVPALMSAYTTIATNLVPVVQLLFQQFQQNVLPALQSFWQMMMTNVVPAAQKVATFIMALWKNALLPLVTFIIQNVLPVIIKFAGPVFGMLISVLGKVISWVANVIGAIADFGTTLLNHIGDVAKFAGAVGTAIGNVVSFFTSLPGKIVGALGDASNMLINVGSNIVGGLISGIIGRAGDLINTIKAYITDRLPDFVKKALGIASPSKVFKQIGIHINEGLIAGIRSHSGKTAAAAKYAVDQAVKAAATAGSKVLDKLKQRAQDAKDLAKQTSENLLGYGSITSLDMPDGAAPSITDVLGNMKMKLDEVKKFGTDLDKLRKMGLRNDVLQQIIAAGPIQGTQIAEAILAAGKKGVSQVNAAQSALVSAGNAVGNTASQSQYGLSTSQANAVVNSSVTVEKGGIVLNIGAGASAADKAYLTRMVTEAVNAALTDAAKKAAAHAPAPHKPKAKPKTHHPRRH